MIKLTIIHPSYKRLAMATTAFHEWIGNAAHPEEIEYFIAMDDADLTVEEYRKAFSDDPMTRTLGKFEIDSGDSTDAIKAMNRVAVKMSPTTEVLMLLADDMGSLPKWDETFFSLFSGVDNFTTPRLIWPSDGYWPWGTVLTMYIVNRAFYNRLGYVLYPGYTSMWSDNDLMEVSRRLGAVITAPQLVFQHKHYSKGYVPMDETYARRNNQSEFNAGRNVFIERQKRNFDL